MQNIIIKNRILIEMHNFIGTIHILNLIKNIHGLEYSEQNETIFYVFQYYYNYILLRMFVHISYLSYLRIFPCLYVIYSYYFLAIFRGIKYISNS